MNNTLDSLPACASGHITCRYVNTTGGLQIVRITNIPGWYFERVVFPGQRLIFQTLPEARLEVHTHECVSAVLSDCIACTALRLAEPIDLSQLTRPQADELTTA
ncbi:MAG: DUF1830 domain-containing protein [Cyanobacteria bacterium P01_A01_bin.114]